MIEVHREEWKPPLAVGAGDVTQLLKECGLIAAKPTFDPRRITRLDASETREAVHHKVMSRVQPAVDALA